jgi:hypothetical protein
MSRWALVSLVLAAACGGGKREVSKIKYTNTTCDHDCAIDPVPASDGGKFVAPDDQPGPTSRPATADAPAPEPTCELVAETLVSLELGNYADPEERAPKVAMQQKRCEGMKLSRDDRQCVVDSYDKTSVAYCVPALFPKEPQPKALSKVECDAITKQMSVNLTNQMTAQRIADQRVWERQLLVASEACMADRWNAAMGQCASYYVPMYADQCFYVQPIGMVKRLQARLAKARGT